MNKSQGKVERQEYFIRRKSSVLEPFTASFRISQFTGEEQNAVDPYFYIPLGVYNDILSDIETRRERLIAERQALLTASMQSTPTEVAPTSGQLVATEPTEKSKPFAAAKKMSTRKKKKRNPKFTVGGVQWEGQLFSDECLPSMKLAVEHILTTDYITLSFRYKREFKED